MGLVDRPHGTGGARGHGDQTSICQENDGLELHVLCSATIGTRVDRAFEPGDGTIYRLVVLPALPGQSEL